MHRDSIEPGVVSDIAAINPKGGSFGSSSTERSYNDLRTDIAWMKTAIWNLLSRVNKLEKEVALIKNAFSETSSGTDSIMRWIWEDDRMKGQVYIAGAWHTCIKGGY